MNHRDSGVEEMETPRARARTVCDFCASSFCERSDYFKHARKKHTEKVAESWIPCSFCTLPYPSQDSLEKHQRQAHQKRPPGERPEDRRTRAPNVRRDCTFCDKSYASVRKYYIHANTAHKKEVAREWYRCDSCTLHFPNLMVLHNHQRARNCEKKDKTDWMKCDFCEKVFSRGYLYFKHANMEHPDVILNIWMKCNQCHFLMPNEKALKNHEFGHKLSQRIPSQYFGERTLCSFCPETLHSLNGYYKHANLMHASLVAKEWLPCKECHKFYPNDEILSYHLSSKHRRSLTTSGVQCPFCDRLFGRAQRLVKHANFAHKEDVMKMWVKCSTCENYFPSNSHLTRHCRRAHCPLAPRESSKTRYKCSSKLTCSFCSKILISSLKYSEHAHAHHYELIKKSWEECYECLKFFPSKAILTTHRRAVHKIRNGAFICKYCNLSNKSSASFLRHVNQDHKDDILGSWIGCQVCGFMSPTLTSYHKHMLECHQCGPSKDVENDHTYSLGERTMMNNFKQTSFDEEDDDEDLIVEEQRCLVFNEVQENNTPEKSSVNFTEISTVKSSVVPSGSQPLSVRRSLRAVKQKRFQDQVYDDALLSEYEMIDEKVFNRNEKYTNSSKPSNPGRVQNSRDCKDHSCDSCGRTFRMPGNLNRHSLSCNNKLHSSKKQAPKSKKLPTEDPFSKGPIHCPKCDELFETSDKFKKHKRFCTINANYKKLVYLTGKNGEKYLECEECGKRFSNPSTLRNHWKVVHMEIREYKCEQCDKDFTYQNHLTKHIQNIHLQQRNFQCEHCGKGFFELRHMNKHIASHHQKPNRDRAE